MAGRVTVPKVIEWLEQPWGNSNATANGIQYDSTPTNVLNADAVWRAVGTKVFNAWPFGYPGGYGTPRMIEVGITAAFSCPDNGDAIIQWKLQGRNSSPNVTNEYAWIDLSDTLTQTRPINAGWFDNTLSGRLPIQTNFNKVPFELQVVYQTNTLNVGRAKMKNSGYVRYQYTID